MTTGGPAGAPDAPAGSALLDAVAVMDRLRGPGGCPWDAEQTPASLLRYLVEETYELYDAVAAGDRAAVREELGDVLLQVLFHARIASEDAAGFDVDDVARDLVRKLVGRHPHVFGDAEVVATSAEQDLRWEELKALEKRRDSLLDGVARAQPGAALLAKYVSRARRGGVPADLLAAVAPASAAGPDPLVTAVIDAASAGADPEGVLRTAASGLADRVRAAETAAAGAGERLDTPEAWRRHWPADPGS